MEEKQIFQEMPQKMVVCRGSKNWFLTVNFNIVAVDGGYQCDSVTTILDHLPTINDAVTVAMEAINAKTDAKILRGYQWVLRHGEDAGCLVNVYLSKENRENFKTKYDLAINKPSSVTFPIKYKVSEGDGATPFYEHFENTEELEDFYIGSVNFIEQCVNDGWTEKDAVRDWLLEE